MDNRPLKSNIMILQGTKKQGILMQRIRFSNETPFFSNQNEFRSADDRMKFKETLEFDSNKKYT